jgi:hypothetical protein
MTDCYRHPMATLLVALTMLLPLVAHADRVYLKNGWDFEVDAWREEGSDIVYQRFGGEVRLPKADVDRIERTATEPTNAPAPRDSAPRGLADPGGPVDVQTERALGSWILWRRIHIVGELPTWRSLEAPGTRSACETKRQGDIANRFAKAKEWVPVFERVLPGKVNSWRRTDDGLFYTTTQDQEIWVTYSCWPAGSTPSK